MNQAPNHSTLDSFEARLLDELQHLVHDRPAVTTSVGESARSSRWRLHRGMHLVGAAAAATATVAIVISVVTPTPAFAVTGRDGEEIHVQVNRLEGAEGLEQALAKHGIAADITYLTPGKSCAPGRYRAIPTPGLTLGVAAEKFDVAIPAGVVGGNDTFVLDASVIPLQNGVQARVNFDIARGPVGPCEVVDDP